MLCAIDEASEGGGHSVLASGFGRGEHSEEVADVADVFGSTHRQGVAHATFAPAMSLCSPFTEAVNLFFCREALFTAGMDVGNKGAPCTYSPPNGVHKTRGRD